MSIERQARTLNEIIDATGKGGYVLDDEIDKVLPEDSESGPELDDVLSRLNSAGIEILLEPRTEPSRGSGEHDENGDQEATQEIAAGDSDPVRVYQREVCEAANLSPEDEVALTKRIARSKEEAEGAKVLLLEANLGLVVSVAKRFKNRGVHLLDLIQEGNIGLLAAVENFDYRRGYQFSTFATWWVRRAIIRATRAKRTPG